MAEHARKPATLEDWFAVPEHLRAEILAGELHVSPRPRAKHGRAQGRLFGSIDGPFDDGVGGPGGWWLVIEPAVRLSPYDLVCPDLAGWRRERVPRLPDEVPIDLVPDWVCEVLSPSTARVDRLVKAELYLRHGVGHYWLLDLDARTLEAWEAREGAWVRLGAWSDEDEPRIPPFDAIALPVGRLFPPEESEDQRR